LSIRILILDQFEELTISGREKSKRLRKQFKYKENIDFGTYQLVHPVQSNFSCKRLASEKVYPSVSKN
jgi:hypothetical protein